jgi:hypothetical protein
LFFGVGDDGEAEAKENEEGMWRVERLAERAWWADRGVFEELGRAKSDKGDDVRGEEGAAVSSEALARPMG